MRRKSVRRARISVATAKEVGGGFSWIDEPRGEKAVRRKVKTLEELLEGLLLASSPPVRPPRVWHHGSRMLCFRGF
jgi:hypothetical protein